MSRWYEVGTIAHIVDVERLPDGRMNLVTVGTERFRLVEIVEREPYMVGRVEPFPAEADPATADLAADVREKFLAYLRDLRPELAERTPSKLAEDPEALSYQLAAALPINPARRQALLAMGSTSARLRALGLVVQREHQSLRLAGRAVPSKSIGPFSVN